MTDRRRRGAQPARIARTCLHGLLLAGVPAAARPTPVPDEPVPVQIDAAPPQEGAGPTDPASEAASHQPPPIDSDAAGAGDIVVTALRRSTTLQNTPISIAALGGELLDRKAARDFIDVAASVPGFTIRDNGPGQRRPVIRGIQGAGEAQVGTYYDEFPITSSPGATNDAGRFAPDIKLVDVERVEVLRGPQGTLFGSGSEGGTLRVVTNKPDLSKIGGSAGALSSFTEKGGSTVNVEGAINVPLVEDVAGLRLVGYAGRSDGFIDNVTLGRNNTNQSRYAGVRASGRIEPASGLRMDLFALYQTFHADAGNAAIRQLGDLKSNLPAYDPLDDTVQLYGVTAQYKTRIATFVGNLSYYRRDLDFNFLFPNLAIPSTSPVRLGTGIVQQPETSKSKTYELRAQSPDTASALTWTVGGFHQDRDALVRSRAPFATSTGVPSDTLPLFQDRFVRTRLGQSAVFGEANLTLFRSLTATVGLRWFTYDVQSLQATLIAGGGTVPSNAGAYGGAAPFRQSGLTKKFAASYKMDRDVLVYVLRSEGYRPGGANQTVSPLIPAGFGSDDVANYEAGLKSQWFNRRLTVNADYYHIDWNGIQVSGSTPDGLFRFTTNAGQAKVDGFEVEVSGRPAPTLDLGLTYGHVAARLSRDQPFIRGVPRRGLAGDRIPAVPADSINLSAENSFVVNDGLMIRLRGEAQHVAGSQNNLHPTLTSTMTGEDTGVLDPYFARYPGYTTYDVRLTFDLGKVTVQGFLRNLTDERGVTYVFIDNFRPAGYTYYIQPRTIGINANVKF
ncbi:TonB-dependent receptor plug domain-containing protein [Sphingomonas sp. RIT328]|uniref:TonB-dependent receptor plug domain-containing protein n=1 Tax=Sphingomonas sp. RIT328 TaxID=1470591 RepID=UPI00044A0AFD|nr:TonB-dependent receptor plug domain-containing protein [Sphingomonas sp. RIT328]EZP49977.1 TonB-dependent receptor precursor [Sphingomonas sp. RIT328]